MRQLPSNAYLAPQTLERSYLLKIGGKVAERPQHMLMRVAVGIHGEDIEGAIETYNLLSEKWFTHASPTLFNAATRRPQLSRWGPRRQHGRLHLSRHSGAATHCDK